MDQLPATTAACRICGNTAGHTSYRVREMRLGLRDTFDYFQCGRCECLQIAQFPADIGKYYPDNYYSYASAGDAGRIGSVSKWLRTVRLKHRMQRPSLSGAALVRLFGEPVDLPGPFGRLRVDPDARILDYGCGSGALLCRLAAKGYVSLTGADPFVPQAVRYDNGVVVHKVDTAGLTGVYDFIMLNHSFEHLPDPRPVLAALLARLAPRGRMLIRIPVVSSHAWRHYREDWVQLDAPRHFFLHSLQSIRLLTEEAGLVTDSLRFDSDALQLWGSEQYRRNIPLEDPQSFGRNPEGSIFSSAEAAAFRQQAERLNEAGDGDQIALLLKRVGDLD